MSEAELEAYAKEHIAYEIRTFVSCLLVIPAKSPEYQKFVHNAQYVAFATHARSLSDFLRNGGPRNTVRACDYIPGLRQGGKPEWAKDIDEKVVHLGRGRTPNYSVDTRSIFNELATEFLAFYDALPPHRKDWFVVIPQTFHTNSI